MKLFQHTFFFRWYKQEKSLTLFLVCFCVVQLLLTILQRESFPWLHYGMYSQPFQSDSIQPTLRFVLNDEPVLITRLPDATQQIILTSLLRYERESTGWSNERKRAFTNWLVDYLEQYFGHPVQRLEVSSILFDMRHFKSISIENNLIQYTAR